MNHNIPIDNLIEIALNNKEGITASNGALIVTTGKRTGRSPKDRFIVEDSITREVVDWSENNQPIESEKFERLWNESGDYQKEKRLTLQIFMLELVLNITSLLLLKMSLLGTTYFAKAYS